MVIWSSSVTYEMRSSSGIEYPGLDWRGRVRMLHCAETVHKLEPKTSKDVAIWRLDVSVWFGNSIANADAGG